MITIYATHISKTLRQEFKDTWFIWKITFRGPLREPGTRIIQLTKFNQRMVVYTVLEVSLALVPEELKLNTSLIHCLTVIKPAEISLPEDPYQKQ